MFKVNYFLKKLNHRFLTPFGIYRVPVNRKKYSNSTKRTMEQSLKCCSKLMIKDNVARVTLWNSSIFQTSFLFIILSFNMYYMLFRPANLARNYMYQVGNRDFFIKVLNLFKVNNKDKWTTSTWGQSDFCSVNLWYFVFNADVEYGIVCFETKIKMTYTCEIFIFVA